MLFTSWASCGLWVKPGLHGFAYLYLTPSFQGFESYGDRANYDDMERA
jgi:hypothetical protein